MPKAPSKGFSNTFWKVCSRGDDFNLITFRASGVCWERFGAEELNCDKLSSSFWGKKKEGGKDRMRWEKKEYETKKRKLWCSEVESKTPKIYTSPFFITTVSSIVVYQLN